MSRLFLLASRVSGGGAAMALALGGLLAATPQQAQAGPVLSCPVPAYCTPLTCRYNALFNGTCTGGVVGGVAYCDCLWP